jgi:hypothetical protein
MPPYDNSSPPPRRTVWDRIAYILCVAIVCAAALYEIMGG